MARFGKPVIPQVFEKLSVLHGSRRLIAAIKKACYLPLYCDINLIYGLPSCTLESILVQCLPSGICPSAFLTRSFQACLFSNVRATSPAHHICYDWILWRRNRNKNLTEQKLLKWPAAGARIWCTVWCLRMKENRIIH